MVRTTDEVDNRFTCKIFATIQTNIRHLKQIDCMDLHRTNEAKNWSSSHPNLLSRRLMVGLVGPQVVMSVC